MTWTIRPYTEELLPGITAVYNSVATRIPFHWPVSEREFAQALTEPWWGKDPRLGNELLVALDRAGAPCAFAHLGSLPMPGAGGCRWGAIRVLFAREGQQPAAAGLIGRGVEWLGSQGARVILAWPRRAGYSFFGLGRGGCWTGLGLRGHFLEAGFGLIQSGPAEVLRATALPRVRAIPLPSVPVQFEHHSRPSGQPLHPGHLHVHKAVTNGTVAGECRWHTLGGFQLHPEAASVANISGLFVHPSYLGSGVARTLMLQAFQVMAGEGVRAVCLQCRASGDAATHRLLESLGFVTLGESYRFSMGLEESDRRMPETEHVPFPRNGERHANSDFIS